MRITVATAFLALATSALPGATNELSHAETEQLSRQFAEAQRTLCTFRANFEQTVSLLGLRNPAVSKGAFFYRAPDDVRIDYSQPDGDFLLLRGGNFLVSKGGEAPRRYPESDRSARVLVALRKVMGGRPDAGAGMVRKIRREGDEYVVSLTPQTPSRDMPEKIENRIDAGSFLLKRMTVTLPRGTSMEFNFSDPERNVKLDKALFQEP
jgi:outer membrane lipoprotein-sorting protein